MMFNSALLKKSLLTKIYFGLMLMGLLGLNACKKDVVDTNAYSAIAVVNASPTVSTYDIYLSGTRINSAAIPFGGSVSYSQRIAGNYDLKFTVAGRAESVFTKTIGLPQDLYHTFFLVGRTAALDGFLVTDDQAATSTTHAYVRFVNVSPDAPALDLFISGGASVITNKTYKAASAFTPIVAGTYTFDVKENSTGTVKTSTESVTLGANLYYTVMARGLITPATGGLELPLSAQVLVSR